MALDCGADQPVVCNCIKIDLSDWPCFSAVIVQSTAADLSEISSSSNKSGSITTLAFRVLPSPLTGFLFATFRPTDGPLRFALPLGGPLGSGPRAGPVLEGPLLGPPGGPLGGF